MARGADKQERSGGVASTMLSRLVVTAQKRDGLTIGEALDAMGESGFGFVMLVLALPALIPVPGPFGLVFGSALAIVALQFAVGIRSLWLPFFLRSRRLPASVFQLLERHARPLVRRTEQAIQPGRFKALTGRALPYCLGLPVFALAVAIALPIPFGNLIPVIAICVMAIGLIEKDGLVVLLGMLLTVAALAVTAALLRGAASLVANL